MSITSKPGRDQPQRRRAEIVRIGPHQLPADRMLFVGDPQPPLILAGVARLDQELIEHHLAQRVRRPEPPRNHPHRPIAIARQRRLHDGKVDRDLAQSKLR